MIMPHMAILTLNTTLAFLMHKLPKPTNVKVHLQDNTLTTTTSSGILTTDRNPEVQTIIKIMLPSIRMLTSTNRNLLTTKGKILIVILPFFIHWPFYK